MLKQLEPVITATHPNLLVNRFVQIGNAHFPLFANLERGQPTLLAPFPNRLLADAKKLGKFGGPVDFVFVVAHTATIIAFYGTMAICEPPAKIWPFFTTLGKIQL